MVTKGRRPLNVGCGINVSAHTQTHAHAHTALTFPYEKMYHSIAADTIAVAFQGVKMTETKTPQTFTHYWKMCVLLFSYLFIQHAEGA